MLIRGEGVTRGYEGEEQGGWIRDALGERWFLTGDRGVLDDHGHLTLTGRTKEMINRGGMKVIPVRVDEALGRHPAVREGVAFAVPHPTLGEDLVAAVVLHPDARVGEPELREHLIGMLAAHEVPSGIVVVESLPRGPSGKLNRIGFAGWLAEQRRSVSPRLPGELEEWVASVFAEVLGVEVPSGDANFFLLGGDSLSSQIVIHRLGQGLGLELDPTLVFNHPSAHSLAGRLVQMRHGGAEGPVKSDPIPAATATIFPVPDGCEGFRASFGQSRLWFLDQSNPGSNAYHLPAVWRVRGTLDRRAMDRALTALVERHPTLRTSFRFHEDTLFQIIHPALPLAFETETAAGRDADGVVEDWLRREESIPFDLGSGRLIRGCLVELQPQVHLLMINHHHIASDGWSRSVLTRDLLELYGSEVAGRTPKLPRLELRYPDFAEWQRDRLQGSRLEQPLGYWEEEMRGIEPLALPTRGLRATPVGRHGASASFRLEPSCLVRFEEVCRAEGATLHMGLLAAVGLLLHRICQRDDFAIGVPMWGRTHPGLDPLVGFFINTLPIRFRFSPSQSFARLLAQVRATSIGAYAHQELPFERIVKALKVEREGGRNPLVQVLVQFTSIPVPDAHEVSGLALERLPIRPVAARFDLEFFLRRGTDGGLLGEVIYDPEILESGMIDRLVGCLITLVRGVTESPHVLLSSVELLPVVERERLHAWSHGESVSFDSVTVDGLFRRRAAQSPHDVALVFGERELTYGDVDSWSDHLAHRLIQVGVGPDVVVAVSLPRSVELPVSVLAILKAGGAYLPIDVDWPESRQQSLLEASGATVWVTDRPPSTARLQVRMTWIDPTSARASDCGNAMSIGGRSRPDALAYVLYTSGSTGQPKGVAMPHEPLVNLLGWQATCLAEGLRTLQFASLGFDVSFQEILGTWTLGGTLVLVAEEVRRDPKALLDQVGRDGVERLFLPVVMLEFLAQAAVTGCQFPQGLREVIVAGEALRITPAIREFFQRLPGCRLWNHYGPTETHVVTAHILPLECREWPEHPSIGRPIANVQVHLLDQEKRMVPPGIAGDIWIGGVAVARGYWRQPELTDERFIPDPFTRQSGGRLYRTGDRGRWQPDGTLEFLGRTDHQVKIRGHRIELGEIEAVLGSHPGVETAVVVVRNGRGSVRSLAAFVTAQAKASVNPQELRSWLRDRLPEVMIPRSVVVLPSLPLNANRKVDRRSLQALAESDEGAAHATPPADATGRVSGSAAGQANEPPTVLELEIARAWRRVFAVAQVDPDADFFEMGGDSLMSVQLSIELERLLGRRVSFALLIRAPTIRMMARALAKESGMPDWKSIVVLQSHGGRVPLFMIHGMGGGIFHFVRFARFIASDQPVFGIEAKESDRTAARCRTVEEMAREYAREIRALQVQGPYRLGGFSLGGWFAHAVGAELERQGEEVTLLLFDTYPGCRVPWQALGIQILIDMVRMARLVLWHTGRMATLPASEWRRYITTRGVVRRFIGTWISRRPAEGGPTQNVSEPTRPKVDPFIRAVARHSAPRVRARVELFQAATPLFSGISGRLQAMFWRRMAEGAIHVHPLSCEHYEMFDPRNLAGLAARVDAVLADEARVPSAQGSDDGVGSEQVRSWTV